MVDILSFNGQGVCVCVGGGGGVLPNSDPFGQKGKGGRSGGCKNCIFFMDFINVWSLTGFLKIHKV